MFPPEGHTPLEGTSPRSSKGGAPFGLLDAAAPAVSPPASFQGDNDDDAAGSVASTAQTTSTVALLQARATPLSHGYLHGDQEPFNLGSFPGESPKGFYDALVCIRVIR